MTVPASRRVLIVEDSYYLATDAARILRGEGIEVLKLCASVEDALAVIERDEPHCAILDINLGAGIRFELADRLRGRAIPFLFYTGYDRIVIPERFAGVACLYKPVKARQLVEAMSKLLLPA